MRYFYDKNVMKVLGLSGWYLNRNISIDDYVSRLKEKGYFVNKEAKRFLSNMGGLTISHESYSDPQQFDISEMNPIKPISWLDPKWVIDYYEKRVADKLCPVGFGFSGHMVFFISSSGCFYGGYDSYFCLIGEGVENGMKNLFFDHKFVSLS